VKDWSITRRGHEPKDFWSQSMCWGSMELGDTNAKVVRVRFSNNGGKSYARCEAHLVYRTVGSDATKVTFAWKDDGGAHQESHRFAANKKGAETWKISTGKHVQTRYVEFKPVGSARK